MSDSISRVTRAILDADGQAIAGYVTAGFPDLERFPAILESVASRADVVEIGVPFSDPMADGLTIQQASHVALEAGVTLEWIFQTVSDIELEAPHVLMGYYNPFLAFGLERLAERMAEVGTSGLIVPDLPLEESAPLVAHLEERGLGLIQLVAPTTPPDRLELLADASRGFVYAVTTKGTTGSAISFDEGVLAYLDRVKKVSKLPVLAGFGVRERSQLAQLAGHVDGVAVGTALIDTIERGDDPAVFIDSLRPVEAR
ncbi:MAG TPA: tryptophan synthase subunit alpha [Acidimicrobiia bacterium]|nr:tryptophan synthase subunit alpha [Acidimicrobiia bacterium]